MRMKNMFNFKASSDRSSCSVSSDNSVRAFSHTIAEEDVETAEQIISKWDLDAATADGGAGTLLYPRIPSLFTQENKKESRKFLHAVAALQTAMHFFMSDSAASPGLVRAHNLMRTAMKRLEKEFFTILTTHKDTVLSPESVSGRSSSRSRFSDVDPETESENENSDESEHFEFVADDNNLPEFVMENLNNIADVMTGAGYGKECVNIYKIVRISIIDEALYSLGVEKSGCSARTATQMQKAGWEALEEKIKKWVGSVRTAVKTIFHGERVLCDTVFANAGDIKDSLFAEISKDNALALFTFAENVAKCKKLFSPEKMFRFLDMYDAVSDIMADIETTLSGPSLAGVRSQMLASLVKLGEAVRTMLSQFEAAIGKDASPKTAVPTGGVHPLTRYVMNYLVFLSDYSGSVAEIIADSPLTTSTPLPPSYFLSPALVNGGIDHHSPETALTVRLAWIILTLLCKLDGKAGAYNNNVALSYLFLANNLNYVVSKVKTSNLVLLMGFEWISTHEAKVKQYYLNYERVGWSRVMTSPPNDPTTEIPLTKVNDYFQQFNSGFEEIYREQISWVIPDPKIRDQVKVSVFAMLVPVYRAFYQKHRKTVINIRYAPEDLESHLSDLFLCNAAVSGGGSSRTTSYGSLSPPHHGAVEHWLRCRCSYRFIILSLALVLAD